MSGWYGATVFKLKNCLVCNAPFQPKSGVHKFCSDKCKGKHQYSSGRLSTENQYAQISGNWRRYFSRLITRGRRDALSVNDLMAQLEKQGGKCALSGRDLTCTLEKGKKCKTNASIDRIEAGGEYAPDNIQLVCTALNSWRADTDLAEFIELCKQVARYHEKGELG